MRYRALDADGDYTFGQGNANFLVDSPEAVAQACLTRLEQMQGSWFLDVTVGTPYGTDILGTGKLATANLAIRARILETQGITNAGLVTLITRITNFSMSLVKRRLSVAVEADTIYGPTEFSTVFG